MSGLLLFIFYSFNPFHTPTFKDNDCAVMEIDSKYDLVESKKVFIKILKVGKNSYAYSHYWPDSPHLGFSSSVIYDSIAFKDSAYSKVDCPQ